MSSPQQRLTSITNQVSGGAKQQLLAKNPDDVVITYTTRTPLTKARKGGLKDTPLDNLLISLLTVCASLDSPSRHPVHEASLTC